MLSEVNHFSAADQNTIESRRDDVLSQAGFVTQGSEVFANHCAACHGLDGMDTDNTPSLFERVPGLDDSELVMTLLQGKGDMPAWDYLSDQELADLLAYLSNTFNPVAQ